MFQLVFVLLALGRFNPHRFLFRSAQSRSRNCRNLPDLDLRFIHLCRPDGITHGLCARVSACSDIGVHWVAAKPIRIRRATAIANAVWLLGDAVGHIASASMSMHENRQISCNSQRKSWLPRNHGFQRPLHHH
jgi:hypothetical protein